MTILLHLELDPHATKLLRMTNERMGRDDGVWVLLYHDHSAKLTWDDLPKVVFTKELKAPV